MVWVHPANRHILFGRTPKIGVRNRQDSRLREILMATTASRSTYVHTANVRQLTTIV
jgi:hypothetical protein